jgi:hypothetical protein
MDWQEWYGVRIVSPLEIIALFRRHWGAIAMIVILTAGMAYHIKRNAQPYVDAATIEFVAPRGLPTGGSFQSLLAVNQVMATYMASPSGQEHVRLAGGTASYSMIMINLNNEDYPDYGVPYSTLSSVSTDPVAAERTFGAAMRVLENGLSSRQAAQGTPFAARIQIQTMAAASGSIEQKGSSKRSLAGLAVLTLLLAYMLVRFLDRHPMNLRRRILLQRLRL